MQYTKNRVKVSVTIDNRVWAIARAIWRKRFGETSLNGSALVSTAVREWAEKYQRTLTDDELTLALMDFSQERGEHEVKSSHAARDMRTRLARETSEDMVKEIKRRETA